MSNKDAGPATLPDAAPTAAHLVSRDADRLIFVATGEGRAAEIARLAAAFAPDRSVVHLTASDALPGDGAPPSAANVGARVAAFRVLRLTEQEAGRKLLVILSAEASAARFAAPQAFDEAPPHLAPGDPIDPQAFAAHAETIGYIADERIDEPGEIAVRGGVIDIFPADRTAPVRIEHADGIVTAIRSYDPITQLGTEELERVTVGRAREPDGAKGVPVTAHLPGALLILDPQAAERRAAFLTLAGDGRPRRRAADGLVDAKAWAEAAGDRLELLDIPAHDPPPRFVERSDPVRAWRRFAKAALAQRPLAIAGSERDLRFLSRRADPALEPAASLDEAAARGPGTLSALVAPVERGFAHGDLLVIAAADLLGSRAQLADAAGPRAQGFALAGELHVGDVVVHEDHGIGAVAGLEAMADGGDAIVLEHAKGARRLLPVAEAGKLWRYGGERDAVTLDALDGSSWQKRRAAIDVAIAESAKALGDIAAARDARETAPIHAPAADYERFAAGFPFAATPDQARAISAVRADLASGRPMDRLVVGDVGYGKTEVALRGVAIVALAGRQAAVVAPTTVLARQHLETLRARFEGTGREVAGLSRLTSSAEKARVKAGLADGSIAVVIGTQAVAGKGIAYHDLALVVIDEEQRFGAATKAKLRELGAGHVLTLSATPIPRTLQSALVGLQAISVIATPPARRQPIRTTVAGWDDATVRKALLRERTRGGQSFVVVPRIADIAPLQAKLAKLVPELGLIVAHGKLDADALDDAMIGFAGGEGDVLLATNIIEAGLDVPRANTMIVHHADRFGLSQLHQLRGRVGRGGRRGQILLLTEGEATLADATLKRLRTLQAFDQLGAGFEISARDLDMRGAGDLVGEEQAGHMKLIGVDLYQHLLGHAVRKARGEAADRWQPVLNLGLAGRLPEDWIPETDVRLSLYGQLARLEDVAEIDAFQHDLEDRFGALPEPASALLDAARLAALAHAAGIRQVDAGPGAIAFTPRDPKAQLPAPFEQAKDRWLARERIDDPAARIERVRELLGELTG